MKSMWNFIKYVFSGQMAQDQLDLYVRSRNPKNEAEKIEAIRQYCRMRGNI